MAYIYFVAFFEIILRFCIGIVILRFYSSKPIHLPEFCYVFMIYYIVKSAINALYLKITPAKATKYFHTYLYEIFHNLTLLIFTIGCFLTLKAKLEAKNLPLFLIPYILSSFLRMVIPKYKQIAYLPLPIYYFLESLAFLFVIFKVIYPDRMETWTYSLLFYIISGFFMSLIGLIFLFLSFMIFILGLFRFEWVLKDSRNWIGIGLMLP